MLNPPGIGPAGNPAAVPSIPTFARHGPDVHTGVIPTCLRKNAKGAKGAVKGRDWDISKIGSDGENGAKGFYQMPWGEGVPHENVLAASGMKNN